MKKVLLALIVVAAMASCTKESVEPITEIVPVYKMEGIQLTDTVIVIGTKYETCQKDVGGHYLISFTLLDSSNYSWHLERGSNYFSEWTGKYVINGDHIEFTQNGNYRSSGTVSKINDSFLYTRTSGIVELFNPVQ
tara:strand:+ start:1580 stop:1987 length:408 start_codon:yes stop_codon:yes gene_type:complete